MSTTHRRTRPGTAESVGSNRWYLSAAPILRALVHLCVPMAAAMIVSAVYNLVNAGFIGALARQHAARGDHIRRPAARARHGGRRRVRCRRRRSRSLV